jgi:rhamnose utilization protein RhaD (predicted bifunctional aldolase and dehydrogenase)
LTIVNHQVVDHNKSKNNHPEGMFAVAVASNSKNVIAEIFGFHTFKSKSFITTLS